MLFSVCSLRSPTSGTAKPLDFSITLTSPGGCIPLLFISRLSTTKKMDTYWLTITRIYYFLHNFIWNHFSNNINCPFYINYFIVIISISNNNQKTGFFESIFSHSHRRVRLHLHRLKILLFPNVNLLSDYSYLL
jgi:hypothetical protein